MEALSTLGNKLENLLSEAPNKSPLNLMTFIFNISLLNNHEGNKIRRQDNENKKILGIELRGKIKDASNWFHWSKPLFGDLPLIGGSSLPYCPTVKGLEGGFQIGGAVISGGFLGYVAKHKLTNVLTGGKAGIAHGLDEVHKLVQMGQTAQSVTQPVATCFKESAETAKGDMQMEKQTLDSDRDNERQTLSAQEQAGQEIRQKMQSIEDKDGQVFGEFAR